MSCPSPALLPRYRGPASGGPPGSGAAGVIIKPDVAGAAGVATVSFSHGDENFADRDPVPVVGVAPEKADDQKYQRGDDGYHQRREIEARGRLLRDEDGPGRGGGVPARGGVFGRRGTLPGVLPAFRRRTGGRGRGRRGLIGGRRSVRDGVGRRRRGGRGAAPLSLPVPHRVPGAGRRAAASFGFGGGRVRSRRPREARRPLVFRQGPPLRPGRGRAPVEGRP